MNKRKKENVILQEHIKLIIKDMHNITNYIYLK